MTNCQSACHLHLPSGVQLGDGSVRLIAGMLAPGLLDGHAGLGERGSMIWPRRHRRFGGVIASPSSDGLCGLNPSRRSRFALLRIAQRGRCNSSTSCDTECVGHKVTSSRSSSSVQRDIAASVMEAPSSSNVPADSCHDLGDRNFSTWNNSLRRTRRLFLAPLGDPLNLIRMPVLIQINTRRSYGLSLPGMTRSSALFIWLPLMWVAILAVLTATFVVLFQ